MNVNISMSSPDQMVIDDDWSDLSKIRQAPVIDRERLHGYRIDRLKGQMQRLDVGLCVMASPISLRYALDYRNYALFCSHIPCTYLFMDPDGEYVATFDTLLQYCLLTRPNQSSSPRSRNGV